MIKHSDILQLCRLCLVEEKVNHSIFEESGDLRGILLKITSCLPVSISQDDSLPKRICETCFTKLDSYYKFWNDSANAEKQLLQWLSQTTLGTISNTGQGDINKSRMEKAEVKEESIDLEDGKLDSLEMSTDAKTYILQQQQLPYSVATPKILPSKTNETDEPASKRPRRASAMKALEHMESEDEDDDLDDGADVYAKAETDDSDKEDENYQEGPSTSMDDQPGPSGVGKGTTETSKMVRTKGKRKLTQRLPLQNENDELSIENLEVDVKLEEYLPVKIEELDKDDKLNGKECSGSFKKIMLSKYSEPKKRRYKKNDPKKIPCKICNRRFTFNYLLKVHFHNDAETNEFKCSLCAITLSAKGDLKTHMSDVHAEQAAKVSCNLCGKTYTYEGDLNRHVKTKHEGFIFKCTFCEKSFNRQQNLQEHMLVKHDETYVKPKYPCASCDKVFSCKKTMMLHVRNIHHGMRHFYVCDMCGKSLATPNSFRNHLRTHTNDKPYPCGVCGKRFGRNHHLQDHLVTHTKEKPHVCSKCGKAFTQRAPLLRHMKCVHETARPFQCLICMKTFATRSLLHTHARLHNFVH